jgi:hypothetical protein
MIYNYIIMTIADWLGIVLTSLSILTILGLVVRWVIRHYLKDIIHELKPNGGSSLKDQVNRLETQHNKLESKVDKIYELLITQTKPVKTTKSKN